MSASPAEITRAEQTLSRLGGFAPQRHIFLCADSGKDECCPKEASDEAWSFLEAAGRTETGRHTRRPAQQGRLPARLRCRPHRRRLPRGHLVPFLHPAVLERILQEHVIGGTPVEAYRLHPPTS
jgi:hypothetical protein